MAIELLVEKYTELKQYWPGLTQINGITRAIIDEAGNSVIVNWTSIDYVHKRVQSLDLIWYQYDSNLHYFLPIPPDSIRSNSTF